MGKIFLAIDEQAIKELHIALGDGYPNALFQALLDEHSVRVDLSNVKTDVDHQVVSSLKLNGLKDEFRIMIHGMMKWNIPDILKQEIEIKLVELANRNY